MWLSVPKIWLGALKRALGGLPWRHPLFLGVLAVIVIYILGGFWTGVLLYKARRTDGAVVWMSRLYPLPIARVDGSFLYPGPFFTLFDSGITYRQADSAAIQDDNELKIKVLTALVRDKILFGEARRRGVVVTQVEAKEAYSQLAEESGGRDVFAEVLRKLYGLSEEQFIALRVRPAVQQKKLEESTFVQMRVRVIITQNEGRLKELIGVLNSGKDFAELAKENSQDEKTRETGGDLGFVGRQIILDSYGEEAEKQLFASKLADVVGPVKTQNSAYALFRIEEQRGEINQRFDEWMTQQLAQKKIWKLY